MSTDERIEKIERQLARVRWFNRCLIACIVLSLGIWFISKNLSVGKEIRAGRFVLVDWNGNTRALLGVTMDGLGLLLYDENGNERASLALFKEEPSLMLIDENGNARVSLGVLKEGPMLQMSDENGEVIWSAP